MYALAPGWCEGPLRRLREAPPLSGSLEHPEDTRIGLLERLFVDTSAPSGPPPAPFVALWEGDLDARALLALHRAGCRGVAVAPGGEAERHAVGAARALGLPLAQLEAADSPPAPGESWRLVVGADDAGWGAPEGFARAGTRRVLPLGALGAAPSPWLELIDAQREELGLAQRALGSGEARGVGLLRLEYLCYADPGMDGGALRARLEELLGALRGWPVALRLTDWGPRKPPPPGSPLGVGVSAARGLAGLWGSASLEAQVEAIRGAASACGAAVRVVAPHAEAPWQVEALRARLGLPLGAMLESWGAVSRWEALARVSDGLWLGLGDLSEDRAEVVPGALERLWAGASGGEVEVFVCGAQRLISGTLR